MKKFTWHTALIIGLALGMFLILSLDASAQCSMCRATLSGSNNGKFLQGFNTGVLVLLIPPVTIFCSIFIVLRKHGTDGSREDYENHEQ